MFLPGGLGGPPPQEVQSSTRSNIQGDVEFISLPCAGKVDPDYLLGALTMGAKGVTVFAVPENCRSIHGNSYARERIREARNYIEEAGHQSGTEYVLSSLSSNMGWYLKEIIEKFVGELKKFKNFQTEIENPK